MMNTNRCTLNMLRLAALMVLQKYINCFSVYHPYGQYDTIHSKKIKSMPNHLFDEGYQFVLFDVKSLFTNIQLQKTIEIILDRIYNKKIIDTNLKSRTLKKLILDTCSKTAFMFDNKIYQQKDGVSMGASLGPVLVLKGRSTDEI